ncbi:MAG: pseudouridine synthase [Balneolaceae bacterium]|nr:MAG: pseudouridine synthase [Balneolaceae bacterium]
MESKNRDRGKNQKSGRGAGKTRNFADWAKKAAEKELSGGGEETGERKKRAGSRPSGTGTGERKSSVRKPQRRSGGDSEGKKDRNATSGERRPKRYSSDRERPAGDSRNKRDHDKRKRGADKFQGRISDKKGKGRSYGKTGAGPVSQSDYLRDEIRLNKFIAHAGLCSRREADNLIEAGNVTVNGKVVNTLGAKVKSSDKVVVNQQKLSLEPFVYILLNKGRDTISTTDDEKDRNTVLNAIEGATGHRVYPVGRLDRNTMGLLILTNDGDLAHRLMHPSFKVKKTYEVTAGRLLSDEELAQLREGVTLEDGPVKPARVKRLEMDPYTIEISVFEGRNHLIRRLIGHLGADVAKLVRVRYGGLRIEDLRVGRWRFLKQKEINDLRRLVKLDLLEFNADKK